MLMGLGSLRRCSRFGALLRVHTRRFVHTSVGTWTTGAGVPKADLCGGTSALLAHGLCTGRSLRAAPVHLWYKTCRHFGCAGGTVLTPSTRHHFLLAAWRQECGLPLLIVICFQFVCTQVRCVTHFHMPSLSSLFRDQECLGGAHGSVSTVEGALNGHDW